RSRAIWEGVSWLDACPRGDWGSLEGSNGLDRKRFNTRTAILRVCSLGFYGMQAASTTRASRRFVLITELMASDQPNAAFSLPSATSAGVSLTPLDPSEASSPFPEGAPSGPRRAASSLPSPDTHATSALSPSDAIDASLPSATVQMGEAGQPE